jgi:hypothetical protein
VIIHNSGRSPEEIQPWMEKRYGFKLRKDITRNKYDEILRGHRVAEGSAMKLKPEDAKKMLALQQELAIVLRRANDQKLEAAVAAFALVRLARELFDKYPPNVRRTLTTICFAVSRTEGRCGRG